MSANTFTAIPISRSQELIWLGQQLQPESPLNNMAFAFTFRERLEVKRFREAFAQLVRACDAMRMVFFASPDGEVAAKLLEESAFELPFYDFSGQHNPDQRVQDSISVRVARVFELSERLFDGALFKQGEDRFVLYLNQHHLITDGWGYAVQLEYLLAAYTGRPLPPLAAFSDYLSGLVSNEKGIAGWEERVAAYPIPPALYGRLNQTLSAKTTRHLRRLTQVQTDQLLKLCARPDVRSWTLDLSMFTVLTTALFAYIYRISGQYELTIGVPAHNRLKPEHKLTAGLFMELFPLHVAVAPKDTFADLLAKVKVESMNFLRHAQPGASSASSGRSFNVVFNFINQQFATTGGPDFTSEWLHPGETEPGHHFKLQAYDFDATGGMTLCFDCNDAVIPRTEQELAVAGFVDLLEQLLANLEAPIAALPTTQIDLLRGFNTTDASYPTGVTVVDLFAEQVNIRPEATAIQYKEVSLSYTKLDAASDALAAELLAGGVTREEIVPICLDRSPEMTIGLLGILKAGAAYLPIDPEFPAERIAFLCADAGANQVVTSSDYAAVFAALPVEVRLPAVSGAAPSNLPLHLRPRPQDLMYVLYTSGSTGKPKGVMNQHDGLVNRLWWMQKTFGLAAENDVVLQKTPFTFDVSGWEFWWPLITGCRLVLAEPGGHKDNNYLRRAIVEYDITTLHFVPPMLELFLLKKVALPSLQRVICSGEALTPNQVNTFRELYPNAELHNLYGPTEAAIDVTHWPAPNGSTSRVPIGKPIDNVPISIYGPNGELRPAGVPGELFIGGVQVARGYLGRPELTSEKFVDLPDGRYYRTGDLCRWLPDGNIEFLGRIDSQVKLRGFRIELGEIEARLLEVGGVKQATVLLRNDPKGEPALVAYLVVTSTVEEVALRSYLSAHLPEYMVPSFFITLSKLPLLRNGKIDRKALPDPAFAADLTAIEAPKTEFEEMIHEVWKEVFKVESIGRNAHFLDLGGTSLTGIRLISRVNDAFELELAANTVFRFPTIAVLALYIEQTIRELLEQMENE